MTKQYGLEAELRVYATSLMGKTAWDWPVSADEWREAARRKLAPGPFGYVDGGAGLQTTMDANRRAFDQYAIRSRMLRNVASRDLSVSLFGQTLPVPFLLAPVGVQSIVHPDGEAASAAAAAAAQVPFILSTVSSVPMEEVARVMGSATRWFQLYPGRDVEVVASFIRRAEAAGYAAIVVTVDTTMLGWRPTDLQNVYLPFLQGEGIANFVTDPVFRARLKQSPEDNLQAAVQEFLAVYVNPAFTWADLERVRALTKLPMLVKGITHPADALLAQAMGMDGVIVSNHGGRQVDGGIASLDALVEIKQAVDADFPILLDSGIRGAADIVKALALGASAALIGRPYAYALAAGGRDGVQEVLAQWKAELDLQVALAGYTNIADLRPDTVTRRA